MDFDGAETTRGVTERAFALDIDGERVPGLIWTPEGAVGARPTILVGHGGTQHKRVPNVLSLARRFVRHRGFGVVAIDAPGHGDRATEADWGAARLSPEERRRRITDMTPEQSRVWTRRNERGVAEWQAVLDALGDVDEIGAGPFGYWGVSMGTAIGLPFVASEPRIVAAVLGLSGLTARTSGTAFERAARRLSVPVLFLFQWGDELVSHEAGLALFGAMGSSEKTMHINPGGHVEIPLFERDSAETFFARHLLGEAVAG
jgi:pimeloyl-ACP methyl ester carboxylesterase